MTFFYFVNCCALTYGPYALIYKNSVLSEYQPYRVSPFFGVKFYKIVISRNVFLLHQCT